MCSIAWAVGLGIAATGMSAYGAYTQQRAANEAADYQADMDELAAQEAIARGRTEELQHRQRVSQMVGRQRSQLAAGGVAVGEGSAYDIVSQTMSLGNLDSIMIQYNASKEAWSHRAQAQLRRNSYVSPLLGATTSILSGASSISNMLYQNSLLTPKKKSTTGTAGG